MTIKLATNSSSSQTSPKARLRSSATVIIMIVDRDTPNITVQKWGIPDRQREARNTHLEAMPVEAVTMTCPNNTINCLWRLESAFLRICWL